MKTENFKIKTFTGKGDWYVSLYDQINGRHLEKFYSGLKKSVLDHIRRANLEILYKEVCRIFKTGQLEPLYINIPQDYSERLTLHQAYDIAHGFITYSNLSEKTKAEYRSHHKNFLSTAKALGRDNIYIDLFKKLHYHQIFMEMSKDCGNHKYNKQMVICKSFFQYLVKNFVIDDNPVHGISQKPHRPCVRATPTDKQQTAIIKYFKEHYCPQ